MHLNRGTDPECKKFAFLIFYKAPPKTICNIICISLHQLIYTVAIKIHLYTFWTNRLRVS